MFLSNRIYALGARPGTVRKEMSIHLPEELTPLNATQHFMTTEMS